MSSNGKSARPDRPGNVKALVVVACNEHDHQSRSLVSIVTGRESIHVARGPWSAHSRDVVSIIANVGCMDTTLKSLEVASGNGARFYMVASHADGGGTLEAWSHADGQVYGVGVDCDDDLPGSLAQCRDEARAIAATRLLADALANMAGALARGFDASAFVPSGGRV